MSHLRSLGLQIRPRSFRNARLARHSFHHLNPRILKLPHLLRIIRQQTNLSRSQLLQNRRAKIVVPRIRRKPQLLVSLHRIHSAILQFISAQLIHQSNPAPFLRQIKQHARRRSPNLSQRQLQLRPAITAHRSQHIPGQALRMHPHQRRNFTLQIPAHQRHRFIQCARTLKSINREVPITRGQFRLRHQLQLHVLALFQSCTLQFRTSNRESQTANLKPLISSI